jgi:transcriptional regulator with XRE-family HTH domain
MLRMNASNAPSQQELAQRLWNMGLEIDRSAISRIENQERQVTDYELIAIAFALGVRAGDVADSVVTQRYFNRLFAEERAVAEDAAPLGLLGAPEKTDEDSFGSPPNKGQNSQP